MLQKYGLFHLLKVDIRTRLVDNPVFCRKEARFAFAI